MPRIHPLILTFPAASYEDAEIIARRLTKAGFDPGAIYIDGSGEGHEVALHAASVDRSRAHRAVYRTGSVALLALAGALAVLGAAAFWAMRSRLGLGSLSGEERHTSQQRPFPAAQSTTMHLTADQAAPDHPDGYLVLNGDADGPATTIEQDSSGRDVRARDEANAASVLQHRYGGVRLVEHAFPDASGEGFHWVRVWVPGYPAARA
jgi:hypothetical protein